LAGFLFYPADNDKRRKSSLSGTFDCGVTIAAIDGFTLSGLERNLTFLATLRANSGEHLSGGAISSTFVAAGIAA
jgi:predicted outer membrane repeat protein